MKKRKLFRFLSLSLALIMLLGALFSCKKRDEVSTDTGDGDDTDELVESIDTEINALNILGERDLGGETITFYLRASGNMWDVKSIYADSILSETVNDAVYERNERLKAQYNFNISVVESGAQFYCQRIINWLEAGQVPADVITAAGYDMTQIAIKGVLLDLKNIDGLNLDREWWNVNLNSQLSIANTLFYASGDIICEDNMAARCLFFNKTMASNHGIDPSSLYEMAKNGEWTMDKMFERASKCYRDKDDVSGKSDKDQFGFVGQSVSTFVFVLGANIRTTEKNADDVPQFVLSPDDSTVIDTISSYFRKDDSVLLAGDGIVHNAFKTNSALFMTEVLGTVSNMRKNWDVKFGILPMPKYSADQTSYNHYADGNCLSFLSMPIGNNAKVDSTAFVLEAMCIESNVTLNPAFYDKALRGRYAYDVESTGMLDIILDSVYIENANLFKGDKNDHMWGVIQKELGNAIVEGRSIATVIAEYETTNSLTSNLIKQSVEKLKDISIAQSYGR